MNVKNVTTKDVQALLRMLEIGGRSEADRTVAREILDSGVKMTDAARKQLQAFAKQAGGGGSGKISAALTKELHRDFSRLDRDGLVTWSFQAPAIIPGAKVQRALLYRERHVDGFAFSAMIVGNPKNATSYYVERTGGFAGVTEYAGPFLIPSKNIKWPPPDDWNPGPVALYSVFIDRALAEGNTDTIRRVRDAAKRALDGVNVDAGLRSFAAGSRAAASVDPQTRVVRAGLAKLTAALGE